MCGAASSTVADRFWRAATQPPVPMVAPLFTGEKHGAMPTRAIGPLGSAAATVPAN